MMNSFGMLLGTVTYQWFIQVETISTSWATIIMRRVESEAFSGAGNETANAMASLTQPPRHRIPYVN
jgi:hypothetical protein